MRGVGLLDLPTLFKFYFRRCVFSVIFLLFIFFHLQAVLLIEQKKTRKIIQTRGKCGLARFINLNFLSKYLIMLIKYVLKIPPSGLFFIDLNNNERYDQFWRLKKCRSPRSVTTKKNTRLHQAKTKESNIRVKYINFKSPAVQLLENWNEIRDLKKKQRANFSPLRLHIIVIKSTTKLSFNIHKRQLELTKTYPIRNRGTWKVEPVHSNLCFKIPDDCSFSMSSEKSYAIIATIRSSVFGFVHCVSAINSKNICWRLLSKRSSFKTIEITSAVSISSS